MPDLRNEPMSDTPLRNVAIVGLGQIGSRFDSEPGRSTVWTHAGAYLARPDLFRIAGACEIDAANVAAFEARCPGVPVFADLGAMLESARPEIVSICTPAPTHAGILTRVAEAPGLRAIWCEKPLSTDAADGARMVEACRARGIHLVVSYVRRWSPLWEGARAQIEAGAVGVVQCVRIALPNRLWSMGSHAVDLLAFLGGPIDAVVPLPIPALDEQGEPAVGGFFRFGRGGYGLFQVTGWKHDYIVEGEIVGNAGRLTVREDIGTIALESFAPSTRYAGYRELGVARTESGLVPPDHSPFVAIAGEIDELLRGTRARPRCDGADALATQNALEALASGRRGHEILTASGVKHG
jgi:predicted dehydrogenase